MTNDIDAQFLCKDCSRFNQCEYYDRRKEDSYICKYFHLSETYGMTNGEVIQALFPNHHIKKLSHTVWVGNDAMCFTTKWWNAPYQKD